MNPIYLPASAYFLMCMQSYVISAQVILLFASGHEMEAIMLLAYGLE